MSLDISRIVNVGISVSPLALQRAGFGILNIFGNTNIIRTGSCPPRVIPADERIRAYNSIDDVAVDFETTDEEYLAASIFFSQVPRPTTLYISSRIDENISAELITGTDVETDLAVWNAITDGGFQITTSLGVETVDGLDFSTAASMQDVASIINTEFSLSGSGPCIYDSGVAGAFRLADGDVCGSAGTISFLTAPPTGTDISSLMSGKSDEGGRVVDGVDAETISETLNVVEAINSKWYGFTFTKEVRDDSQTSAGTIDDCLDAAAWAEARVKTFWNNSSDANTLVTGDTTSISYQLEQLEYNRTATIYNAGDYPAVSLFARGATVDFDGTNTTITYKFKQLPGLTASDLSATQADNLIAVNCNYYAEFGTQLSGDSVAIVAEGVMANGRFIDEVVGIDWLQNAIQTDEFNYLYQSTTKIPQTDEGVAGMVQVLSGVLDQAVNNGLAAPGYVTIEGETVFLPKGYEIFTGLVEDQSQASREAREAPPISFVIKGAGAIHSVTISGTFTR